MVKTKISETDLAKALTDGRVTAVPGDEFKFIYEWRNANRNTDGSLKSIAEAREAFQKHRQHPN